MRVTKDQLVYIKHPEQVWAGGIVVGVYDDGVEVRVDSNQLGPCSPEFSTIFIENAKTSEDIVLRDLDEQTLHDDLCAIKRLNDATLLNALKKRYSEGKIYTSIKDVIIAINPYTWNSEEDLYSEKSMRAYSDEVLEEDCPPHLFRVSNLMFHQMKKDHSPQSVIIGGESGSGKTESVKLLVEHLLFLSEHSDSKRFMDAVLKSNLLLEYMGNATTIKNNNSSRYGKLITLMYDSRSAVVGAKMDTFLLEKKRTCMLDDTNLREKGFHALSILQKCSKDMVEQPSPSMTAHEHSLEEFIRISEQALQLSAGDKTEFLSILKAITSLIQTKFDLWRDENYNSEDCEPFLTEIGGLLGLDAQKLQEFITHKAINIKGEGRITSRRSFPELINHRNSIASEIYFLLFQWTVIRINEILSNNNISSSSKLSTNGLNISLLDIFGFERLEEGGNSIEQFLINYANEKLHYHFLSSTVIAEQELYRSEGLVSVIPDFSFERIERVLFMIESPRGIIDIMNDQVNLRQGDQYFLKQIKQSQASAKSSSLYSQLTVDRFAEKFSINHYAGDVEYIVTGFSEGNHSVPDSSLLELLRSSSNSITKDLADLPFPNENCSNKLSSTGTSSKLSSSVAKGFRNDLESMITHLNQSTLSFIKCIKPNDEKIPWLFQNRSVHNQLKNNGLLEAISVIRSKYPFRMKWSAFSEQYHTLITLYGSVEALLRAIESDRLCSLHSIRESFLIGKSMIFLEDWLIQRLNQKLITAIQSTIMIQSIFRSCLARRAYNKFISVRRKVAAKRIHSFITRVIYSARVRKRTKKLQDSLFYFDYQQMRRNAKIALKHWKEQSRQHQSAFDHCRIHASELVVQHFDEKEAEDLDEVIETLIFATIILFVIFMKL